MLRKHLFLFLFFFPFAHTYAQTPEALSEKAAKNFAREKIFIHFDRETYIAGETVFFKAYLSEGFLPGRSSTALNVELMNDSSTTLQKLILPVTASIAVGSFELPQGLVEGSYTVRAFTRRGMNFGTDNFFYHTLRVFNKTIKAGRLAKPISYSLKFFPEGGHLIAGKRNTVGFICIDDRGFPADVKGEIKTGSGKEVAEFKSSHNGMGKFEFTPLAEEVYRSESKAGESKFSTSFPPVDPQGVTLKIQRKGSEVFFETDHSGISDPGLRPAYLLGIEENLVAFKVSLNPDESGQRGKIPVENMPSGILHITVFNSLHKALAERLVFVNSEDYRISGKFVTDTLNTSPRGRNVFSFELPDTLTGTYSVAVTDAGDETTETSQADNIISRFLLTDDLRGYIHNPAYYFQSNDDRHAADLDLVMMTHGWRRYSWQELMSDRFSSLPFKDLNYISFTGTVFDPFTKKPYKWAELDAIFDVGDSTARYFKFPINDSGLFSMKGLIFAGAAMITFRNNSEARQRTMVKTNVEDLSTAFNVAKTKIEALDWFSVNPPAPPKRISLSRYGNIDYADGITLREVIVKTKQYGLGTKIEQRYAQPTVGTSANTTLNFLLKPATTEGISILDYLRSKLPSVSIGAPPDYFVNYRQTRSLMGGPIPMNIFIDGIQQDPQYAAVFNVEDVALVQVFSTGLGAGAGGALSISLKKPEDRMTKNTMHTINSLRLTGFSQVKEFYSPDYSPGKDDGVLRDERTTLYWNPYLYTGQQGKMIRIPFYNSDGAKKFRVVLQGFTQDGQFLFLEKNVE